MWSSQGGADVEVIPLDEAALVVGVGGVRSQGYTLGLLFVEAEVSASVVCPGIYIAPPGGAGSGKQVLGYV